VTETATATMPVTPAPRRLLVATRSRHKLRELRELLALPDGVELLSPDDVGIPDEPEETGETFETNARIKARFYAVRSGLPTLADDSGLEVDALGGGPGVRTRRYAGPDATDADNNAKLLRELDGLAAASRGARYVCVLAIALPGQAGPRGGLRVATRRGTCRGRIATGLRGDAGFGYDPLFEPAEEPPGGRTLGQWSAAEKHAISHRSRAARRMTPLLLALGFGTG
jgi:XTP/dITP diphosphohydrolase